MKDVSPGNFEECAPMARVSLVNPAAATADSYSPRPFGEFGDAQLALRFGIRVDQAGMSGGRVESEVEV